MKVLLIDVNCKNSSTGKIVYDLYSFLNNNGDEAAVCYGRGAQISEKDIFKFGLDWETYLHAFLTRITGFTGCYSYFSTKRLLRFIEEFKPDIVHIHELHAYFVNIKSLLDYLKKNNIKTVMTLHCEFAYTGKCGHAVECEKWKTECGKCPHLKDYPSSLFLDQTKHMFNQKKKLFINYNNLVLSAPSQWLCDRIKQSFLNCYECKLIYNGIDTDIFQPVDGSELKRKYNIENKRKVILSVAPNLMSNEKGGKYVVEIAKKLPEYQFVLVGVDGIEEIIHDNIIKIGRIRDKKLLAKFYSMADAFLICSQRENYPTTCLEAQACGTPVYGFSTGGTVETSLLDISSHFVTYGDVDALVALLKTAKMKPGEEFSHLRDKAVAKLGNEKALTEYISLYSGGR